jgi:hypothetical protein
MENVYRPQATLISEANAFYLQIDIFFSTGMIFGLSRGVLLWLKNVKGTVS